MVTRTEKQGKPMSRVVMERLKRTEIGSCKECLYCEEAKVVAKVPLGPPGEERIHLCTHFCVMMVTERAKYEGAEWFTEGELDKQRYPRLDTCVWELSENCCFSFMPRDGVEAPEPAEHRKYMEALVKIINDADLTELGFLAKECQPRGGKMPEYLNVGG